jgi:hypothetical protein
MNKEKVVYGYSSNHICGGAMELILENQETVLIDVSVAQSLGLCVVFCRSLFILFHLIIVV